MAELTVITHALRKRFERTPALSGVDMEISAGEIFALLGPNGAGKTTLVRILTTLQQPDSGYALVNGWNVVTDPAKARSSLGVAGQASTVDGMLTGFENLYLIAKLHGMGRRKALAVAGELIDRFRLAEAAGRIARTYSGGMRRRLDLAAALVSRPPLVILDEPTTGLDPESRLDTWDSVNELAAEGTTILLTTQYLEEADRLADRIMVIDKGKVIATGTSDELKATAGPSRLVLTVAKDHQVAAAVRVATHVGDAIPAVDDRAHRVEVTVHNGQEALAGAVSALAAEQVEVLEIGLTRPTLDDVFFGLTQRQAAV